MKGKICPKCNSLKIKFGSNISCTNKECKDYINDGNEVEYVDFYSYGRLNKSYLKDSTEFTESDFVKEYDDFLFFSDMQNYISRFEYRKMSNFIEKDLFYRFKIARFKRYLPDSKINLDKIEEKYELMDKGRNLEYKDSQKALEFYKSLLNNRLFKNDYYLYRKIVKLEKDYQKQFNYIMEFFHAGIYCDRYNYLWFLKKIYQLSKKINVSNQDIENALYSFKKNGFTNKKLQDEPCHIAEKITLNKSQLKVRTEKAFALRQFRYELEEEYSNLNALEKYHLSTPIYEDLILKYGFRKTDYFMSICRNYLRMNDNENALRWIYGFFNKAKRINNPNDWWFEDKIAKLKVETNLFNHNDLFFDNDEYYLDKDDFKNSDVEFIDLVDYITKIKDKDQMIVTGLDLEASDPNEAIKFYHSLLNHELFKNDYYPYVSLVLLYDKIGDYETEIDTIISFFKSGIYCDRYNYLFFIYHLKKLSQKFIIYDDEINDCLKSFKKVSFKNKCLENSPVPLADRISFRKNELKIIPGDEFKNKQEIAALNLELELFESFGMTDSVNNIFWIMIDEYEFGDGDLFIELCQNYQRLHDVESEIKVIEYYFNRVDNIWNFKHDKWFNDRMNELKNIECIPTPLKEPKIEILYENNEYWLNHQDFKYNDVKYNELLDKTISKYKSRNEGRKLEFNEPENAIEFYKSLLDDYKFENDYYPYRRLVLLYERYNNFEKVWQTIKEFFHSGIYCDRYQYIWFLHKIANVSRVKYISNEEISDCLKSFKENGFKNSKLKKNSVFLAERLYRSKSSVKIESPSCYSLKQIKYELKEEVFQLDLNGFGEESVEILRKMVENGCETSTNTYMRLCHKYRELGQLEDELKIINMYFSKNKRNADYWFEKRLNEVNELINEK